MSVHKAINRLSARKIGRHWYYFADETGEWYRVPTRSLKMLSAYLNKQDGYSLWCADYYSDPISTLSASRLGLI